MPEYEPLTAQSRAMRQYLEQQHAAGRIGGEELAEGRRRLALLCKYEHQENQRNPLETPAERAHREYIARCARSAPGLYGPMRDDLNAIRARREEALFRTALDRTNNNLRDELAREYREQEYQQWRERTERERAERQAPIDRWAQDLEERVARQVQHVEERVARRVQETEERMARRAEERASEERERVARRAEERASRDRRRRHAALRHPVTRAAEVRCR